MEGQIYENGWPSGSMTMNPLYHCFTLKIPLKKRTFEGTRLGASQVRWPNQSENKGLEVGDFEEVAKWGENQRSNKKLS